MVWNFTKPKQPKNLWHPGRIVTYRDEKYVVMDFKENSTHKVRCNVWNQKDSSDIILKKLTDIYWGNQGHGCYFYKKDLKLTNEIYNVFELKVGSCGCQYPQEWKEKWLL